EPGDWDVFVQNPDGYSDTLPGGFTVLLSPWGDDLRLTDDDAESSLSQSNARSVAVDSQGHLHVVWSDNRDGNREIYYKSFDGAAWSADLGSTDPGIAVDGNDNLHVVWNDYRHSDYEIYYKRFDGASWGADTRLTSTGGDSRYPSVAVDALNRIHVVWQDKRGGERTKNIYFRLHDGMTWQAEENIASDVPGSQTPAIAVDGNNHAHVAWRQDYGDSARLYYKKFNGSAWGEEDMLAAGRLDWDPPNPPTITTDHLNQVHVAWDDYLDGSYEVFYRIFDGGAWSPRERVSGEFHNSSKASVVVDNSGSVHMIWVDRQDGNNEIYYACKKGLSWGQQTRLTKAPNESIHPSLVIAPDGALHMVWRDYRDGNSEVYYKMRDSDALAGIDRPVSRDELLSNLRVVPNPILISTQVQLDIGRKVELTLSIYDVAGRLVRRIEPGVMDPGPRKIGWDGRGSTGDRVAPGIYFLEMSTGTQAASTKVIVLR
ncbi:FlgD immunoglobulin-like domain containing protein, partial [Candidatus Eisenbacteria bacterium]